jgi:hypothetical protein
MADKLSEICRLGMIPFSFVPNKHNTRAGVLEHRHTNKGESVQLFRRTYFCIYLCRLCFVYVNSISYLSVTYLFTDFAHSVSDLGCELSSVRLD